MRGKKNESLKLRGKKLSIVSAISLNLPTLPKRGRSKGPAQTMINARISVKVTIGDLTGLAVSFEAFFFFFGMVPSGIDFSIRAI